MLLFVYPVRLCCLLLLPVVWQFWQIGYTIKCRFTPISSVVIVIHAEDFGVLYMDSKLAIYEWTKYFLREAVAQRCYIKEKYLWRILFKQWLQCRCFALNFAKFSITSISIEHSGGCFWEFFKAINISQASCFHWYNS